MTRGYTRSGFNGTMQFSRHNACGEQRFTCHNATQLLHQWEKDHSRTCVTAQLQPNRCDQPGCLHCNP